MSDTTERRLLDRKRGRFRSTVTDLEMRVPPQGPAPAPPRAGVRVARWDRPDPGAYLDLFRRIGQSWLWHGRLVQDAADLAAMLRSPELEVWRLWVDDDVAGLCELDRSRPGEVLIAYFGLAPEYIGSGLGGFLMRSMLRDAWRGDVRRVWLHTCTEDHPGALRFYQHMGFVIRGRRTEWVRDPRLQGLLPREAAPQVPIPE